MLTEIVRRYKSFNPDTGEFDCPRGVREYARVLGVNGGQLSQVLNGIQRPGMTIIRALAQTFPPAADEIADALRQPTEEEVVAP